MAAFSRIFRTVHGRRSIGDAGRSRSQNEMAGHCYGRRKGRGGRSDRAQGAFEHEAKADDLPLVRQHAHEAARFNAVTFPDRTVTALHKAPSEIPGTRKAKCAGWSSPSCACRVPVATAAPALRHTEGFRSQVATKDGEETERYGNAIAGNGGTESACGGCKDRWGLYWQITPRALTDALAAGGNEAQRPSRR